MKNRCFVDLDGVLADFVRGALAFHKKEFPYDDVRWDFHESLDMSQEKFWQVLGESFWAGLDRTDEFDGIAHAVLGKFDPKDVFILSSPCQTPGCVTGKARWVEDHLPEFSRRLLLTSDKEIFAGQGVLIDDSESNTDKWEASGGKAFLFPRPWNKDRTAEPQAVAWLQNWLRDNI